MLGLNALNQAKLKTMYRWQEMVLELSHTDLDFKLKFNRLPGKIPS